MIEMRKCACVEADGGTDVMETYQTNIHTNKESVGSQKLKEYREFIDYRASVRRANGNESCKLS